MARGDKSAYTDKQKRQARHIEEGYKKRGVGTDEAGRRAWATVNRMGGGGKLRGSGRGKGVDKAPAKKGGTLGAKSSASRPAAARSKSARKAAITRARVLSGARKRSGSKSQARTRTRARIRLKTRAHVRVRAKSRRR